MFPVLLLIIVFAESPNKRCRIDPIPSTQVTIEANTDTSNTGTASHGSLISYSFTICYLLVGNLSDASLSDANMEISSYVAIGMRPLFHPGSYLLYSFL